MYSVKNITFLLHWIIIMIEYVRCEALRYTKNQPDTIFVRIKSDRITFLMSHI